MKINSRLDQIVTLLNEHGFLTVTEISRLCDVSEMTVRRDLDLLNIQNRIQRTYGGAVPLNNKLGYPKQGDVSRIRKAAFCLWTRLMY